VSRVTAAISAAQTRDAVLKLDQVAVANRALFAAVSPEVAKRETGRLAAAQRQGLARLMIDERRHIDSFGSGLAAVEEGASWYREFSKSYQSDLSDDAVTATLGHFAERRELDLRPVSSQLVASLRKTANDRELGVFMLRYTTPVDRNGAAGGVVMAAVAEQQRKFVGEALDKATKAEADRDQLLNSPVQIGAWAAYNAPGILAALHAGTYKLLADDTLTRDYVLSVKSSLNGLCPNLAEGGFSLLDYGMYYEMKALKKGTGAAFAGDVNQTLRQLLIAGHGGLGKISGMAATAEHLMPEGQEDGKRLANETCGGRTAELQKHMIELADDRGQIPPDLPDYPHFLLRLNARVKPKFAAAQSTGNTELAHKLKQSCGVYVRNAYNPKQAEGYCRCEVKMMLDAHLPPASLERLLPSNMTMEALHEMELRFPRYQDLSKQCFN
jgi:hypothetical protein